MMEVSISMILLRPGLFYIRHRKSLRCQLVMGGNLRVTFIGKPLLGPSVSLSVYLY